ncbi:MAG TPA: PAS domain-containing protein, partial [Thermoanaerobaculaceae bacterium]|nr:PAS domain-containing protein [Thermoanaerobaculaceae bacterium]
TGWTDESGTVERCDVLAAGPVRTVVAVHKALSAGYAYEKTYTFYSGDRRGKAFGAFVEENPGKIVLSEKEWITVQRMLKAIGPVASESRVLEGICASGLEMVGQAGLVAIVERQEDNLLVRARARRGGTCDLPEGRSLAMDSFAELVMTHGKTAALDDVTLRPDLRLLDSKGDAPFRSVMASPVRLRGEVVGALAAYSRAPQRWSADQFRIMQWLAAECSRALENARLHVETQRQATLIDLSPDGIMVRRMDGTITLWGHGAEVLYGFSKAEAVGQTTHALLSTRFPQPLPEIERQVEATGSWSGELVHRAKDGRLLVVQSRWLAQRDARGAIAELLESNVDITDRKRMEEALAESKRRLALIVDSIADGFFAFDPELRVTHINDAALRHFGKTRDEMLGQLIFDVFPSARGGFVESEYRRALASGQPVQFEAQSILSDKVLEFHVYPGPDNMTILFRDISERIRLATALREAHDRAAWMARFPEENPRPVIRASADGTVLYRNPTAARLPGWSCGVGQPLAPELAELVREAMDENGRELNRDVALEEKAYAVSVTPFPAEGYANLYGLDITARKQLDETLRRNEATLRAILDATKESVWLFSPDGLILMANQIAASRVGKPAGEVIGKAFAELIPSEVAESRLARLQETVDTGQPVEFEDERNSISFHHSFYPVLNAAGDVISIAAFSRDITGRKRTDEALRASLREKEVLLKEIHHRVKNNLQIIASLLNLQMDSIRDETDRELLIESQQRVRTLALIHEKLYGSNDFSRIPFRQYATELCTAMLRGLQAGNVTLAFDIEDVPLAIGSAIPLALILNELISNAIKHAFPGGREGHVTVSLARNGSRQLVFSVRDDGVGFPEALDIEHAGTLGLQIVSILAGQLRGHVTFGREGGSRVTVSFTEAD